MKCGTNRLDLAVFTALLLAAGGLVSCEREAPAPGTVDRGERVSSGHIEQTTPSDPIADDPADYLTRFCTFNVEDVRYDDIMAALRGEQNEQALRVRDIARLIAAIDPDVLLVNELEHDHISSQPLSGEAFAQLIRQQRAELGMEDRVYATFQAPSNTGIPSGFDLDRNGEVVFEPGSRAYGGDAFGYGEFPGQYAMGLFVAEPLVLHDDRARTFQNFLWSDMPDALLPMGDGERVPADEPWFTPEMLEVVRLSSKSHWDVPVELPDGTIVHILASHPTPPVFDGPENRNGRRNHDEIRFWGEYLDGADWIVDDEGVRGGASDAPVVLMGDLNADPIYGDSHGNPIGTWIFNSPRINGYFVPRSFVSLESGGRKLRPEATSDFGLRVDYVLPSKGLLVLRGGIVRGETDLPMQLGFTDQVLDSIQYDVSDHFPVWIDLRVPGQDE